LECKILLIDTIADITLLKDSLTHLNLPFNIQYVTSVEEATATINTKKPDLLMVGSSHVLKEGFEPFFNLGSFPMAVLCESKGLIRFLKNCPLNLCFIVRPLEVDGIPDMIEKAYEFMLSRKEI
jgi:hypothetical protein